jgi:WD40 repeat protein
MIRLSIVIGTLFIGFVASLHAAEEISTQFAKTDANGDALSPGSIARFGSTRFRTATGITQLLLSPDEKILVAWGEDFSLNFFDHQTGRLLHYLKRNPRQVRDAEDFPLQLVFQNGGKNLLFGSGRSIDLETVELHTWKSSRALTLKDFYVAGVSGDGNIAILGREAVKAKTIEFSWVDLRQPQVTQPSITLRRQNNNPAMKIAVSTKGERFALTHREPEEQEFRLLVFETRQMTRPLVIRLKDLPTRLDFTPDGKRLLILFGRGAELWEIDPAREKPMLRHFFKYPFESGAESLVLSRDEKFLLMSGIEGVVTIYDFQTGGVLRNWNTRSYGITDLDFTRDGKTLITSSRYETIPRFWDFETATDRNPKRGHRDRISGMQFLPSGKELISVSDDGSIRVWNLEPTRTALSYNKTPRVEERYRSMEAKILCETIAVFYGLWLSEDGQKLLAWKGDEGIVQWNLKQGGKGTMIMPMNNQDSRPLILSPNGEYLAGVRDGGILRVFSTANKREVGVGRSGTFYEGVGFHPDQRTLLATTNSGSIERWDLVEGKIVHQARPIDPDLPLRQRLFYHSRSEDGYISFWNRFNGRPLRVLEVNTDPGAISPNGRYFLTFDAQQIRMHDLASGQGMEWKRNSNPVNGITHVKFSPDGKLIAIGYRNGLIELYPFFPLKPLAPPTDKELKGAWADLLNENLLEVRTAIERLTSHPERSLPWLSEQIVLPKPVDRKRIDLLLQKLEHPRFRIREQASKELEKIGDTLELLLTQMQSQAPNAELSNRYEKLLQQICTSPIEGERLRILRVIEILERVGNASAKAILKKIGDTEDRLLRLAARDAMHRLQLSESPK